MVPQKSGGTMNTLALAVAATLFAGATQTPPQQFTLRCEIRGVGDRVRFEYFSFDLRQRQWCLIENGLCGTVNRIFVVTPERLHLDGQQEIDRMTGRYTRSWEQGQCVPANLLPMPRQPLF
jgi:hypothetical protein